MSLIIVSSDIGGIVSEGSGNQFFQLDSSSDVLMDIRQLPVTYSQPRHLKAVYGVICHFTTLKSLVGQVAIGAMFFGHVTDLLRGVDNRV